MGEKVCTDYNEVCEIGNDVWIAAGVNILHKCKIGNGAIIGAGAVVTKDVEPYSIITGIPGKSIKKRFSDELITELEAIKWWEWDIDTINNNRDLLFHTSLSMDVISQMKKIANAL